MEEVTCLSFNQDRSCLAVGLTNGFRIFNLDPFQELYRHVFDDGGVGVVEMLFRTNVLALVGCETRPQFPPTNLVIWDNVQQKPQWELKYRQPVRGVKLQRDRMLVVVEQRVVHYSVQGDFAQIVCTHHIDTGPNPKGLCSLAARAAVFACPLKHDEFDVLQQVFGDVGPPTDYAFKSHKHPVECMCISDDGSLVATASEEGTILRVFCPSETKSIKHELTRGTTGVTMLCISFSGDNKWIACVSDKGTVHIFSLDPKVRNKQSMFGLASTQRSVGKYTVDELSKNPSSLVTFCFGARSNTLFVVTETGMHVCEINISSREPVRRVAFYALRPDTT